MSFTREETAKFYNRSTMWGVAIFTFDFAVLSGLLFLSVWCSALYLQFLFSMAAATMIAALFVIGHDAAHDSLTPSRRLNRVIGTLAFLPSMHPFSLWVKLHNLRHHHWTCLYPKDDVWTPHDMQTYQSLPWYSQAMYRFYRGPFGSLLYYLVEFWWKKFSWPTRKYYTHVKRVYVTDTLIMWAFAGAYLAMLVYGAGAGWWGGEPRPWWNSLFFGAVLPFFVWNFYSGVSIYLQHTHPRTIWYNDEAEWRQVNKAHTAVHAVFPWYIQRTFHFIMEHSVHHLRPGVPYYHLAEAQGRLEEHEHGKIITYRWTPARFMDICRRCKLYDYEAKRWMNFEGEYTSSARNRATKKNSSSQQDADVTATATA